MAKKSHQNQCDPHAGQGESSLCVHRSWGQATGQHTGVELGRHWDRIRTGIQNAGHRGKVRRTLRFLVPVAEELDLKRRLPQWRKGNLHVQIQGFACPDRIHSRRLFPYRHEKLFRTTIHESAQNFPTILCSSRQDRTPAGTVTGQFAAGRALSAGGHHRGESTMRYCCTVFQRVGNLLSRIPEGQLPARLQPLEFRFSLLHDNILQRSGFGKILQETLPAYNQYGITVVNWTQWQCILQHALAQGGGGAGRTGSE